MSTTNTLGDSVIQYSTIVSNEINIHNDHFTRDNAREEVLKTLCSQQEPFADLAPSQKQALHDLSKKLGIRLTESDVNIISILKNEISRMKLEHSNQEIVSQLTNRLHTLQSNFSVGIKRPLISNTSFSRSTATENEKSPKRQKLPGVSFEDEEDQALRKKHLYIDRMQDSSSTKAKRK